MEDIGVLMEKWREVYKAEVNSKKGIKKKLG